MSDNKYSSSDFYPRGDTPVHGLPGTKPKGTSGPAQAPATIPMPQEKHYGFVPHGLIGTKK